MILTETLRKIFSSKIDKYECEKVLPSNQSQIIEHAKFTNSFLERFLNNKEKRLKMQLHAWLYRN